MNVRKSLLPWLAMAFITSPILAGCERPEPEQVRANLHLPSPDFVVDAKRGGGLFQASCARCHGEGARGTREGPPLVHEIYRPGHHTDLSFHLAVRNGVRQHHWNFGNMAPLEELAPEDTGHIIAYV
ncbi:MAG: cytochrome c, partial [Gammaproteobacteria bacterium]